MGSAASQKSGRKRPDNTDQNSSDSRARLSRRLLVIDPHAKSDLARAISSAQTEQDYVAVAETASQLARQHVPGSRPHTTYCHIRSAAAALAAEMQKQRERKGLLALSE